MTATPKNAPAILAYGSIMPARDVASLPDLSPRYHVAFEVTRTGTDDAQISPAVIGWRVS